MTSTDDRINSASVEDYAKAIYSLTHGRHETASTTDLARRLQITAGSVSTMLKRMGSYGLVEHIPYHGVRLTEAGEQTALRVIRRHRLIELFLHESLKIPWQDVDRYADRLEHAVTDELIEIIADRLGDPTVDPHGDPIPTRTLKIESLDTRRLDELQPGEQAVIARVSDSDPDKLRYLTDQDIAIGDRIQMVSRQPFGGPIEIRVHDDVQHLGLELASAIRVTSAGTPA